MLAAAAVLLALLGAPVDAGELGPPDLPRSLLDGSPGHANRETTDPEAGAPGAPERETEFSLGPAGGYLHAKGADRGTWFAGAQARLHFLKYLAAEGSITFHENHY